MSVCLYLPLCCGRTAPKVREEEGSYASHFYHWFLESFKSCLLLLVALPGLTLFHSCLKVPAMIVYDVATKVLDKELFPQHSITGLISSIAFIVLFSQQKPLIGRK